MNDTDVFKYIARISEACGKEWINSNTKLSF